MCPAKAVESNDENSFAMRGAVACSSLSLFEGSPQFTTVTGIAFHQGVTEAISLWVKIQHANIVKNAIQFSNHCIF